MEEVNEQAVYYENNIGIESDDNNTAGEEEEEALIYSLVHHSKETYEDQEALNNLNSNQDQDCNESPFTVSRRNKVFRLDAVKEITGVLHRNTVPSQINNKKHMKKIIKYKKKRKQLIVGDKSYVNKMNENIYINEHGHNSHYQLSQNEVHKHQWNNINSKKHNKTVKNLRTSIENSRKPSQQSNLDVVDPLVTLFNGNQHQYDVVSTSLTQNQKYVENVMKMKVTIENNQKISKQNRKVNIQWEGHEINGIQRPRSVAECIEQFAVTESVKDASTSNINILLNEYVPSDIVTEPVKSISNTNIGPESKSTDKIIESPEKDDEVLNLDQTECASKYDIFLKKKMPVSRDNQPSERLLNSEETGLPVNYKDMINLEDNIGDVVPIKNTCCFDQNTGLEIICLDSSSDSGSSVVEVFVPTRPPPPMVSLDSSDESSITLNCSNIEKSYNSASAFENNSSASTVILASDGQNKKKKKKKKKTVGSTGISKLQAVGISPTRELLNANQDSRLSINIDKIVNDETYNTETRVSGLSNKSTELDNLIVLDSSPKSQTSREAQNSVATTANTLTCVSEKGKGKKRKKKETVNRKKKKKCRVEGFTVPDTVVTSSESTYRPLSWTSDMVHFYDDSWGGEDYNHIKLQQKMSGNPSNWKILDKDRYGPLQVTGPKLRMRCNNCRELGHNSWRCPAAPKVPCCYMCGQQGHCEPRCPNKICLKCGRPSYLYVHGCAQCNLPGCPFNCLSCGQRGHFLWQCPERWRLLHSTTNEEAAAAVNQTSVENPYKPSQLLFCSNCAKSGHHVDNCHFLHKPMTFHPGERQRFKRPLERKNEHKGKEATQTVVNSIPHPQKKMKSKTMPNNMSQPNTIVGTKVKSRLKRPKKNKLRAYITKKYFT